MTSPPVDIDSLAVHLLPRSLLCLVLLLSSGRSLARSVGILDFAPDRAVSADAWLPGRVSDALVFRLRLLGIDVPDRGFAEKVPKKRGFLELGIDAIVSGRVTPETVSRGTEQIALNLTVHLSTGRRKKCSLKGPAKDLDLLVSNMAILIADAVGHPVSKEERELIREMNYPFTIHRFLGRGRARLDAEQFPQAAMMYGRAASFEKHTFYPEAYDGRRRAMEARIARGLSEYGSNIELARSAAERAQVSLRAKDHEEAIRALETFMRYTTRHALRWAIEIPLRGEDTAVLPGGNRWIFQRDVSAKGRWALDPRTGTVLDRSPGLSGLAAASKEALITLKGRFLSRIDGREVRWKTRIPFKTDRDPTASILIAGGHVAVLSDNAIAWIDSSLGKMGQHARRTTPLATSAAGIVALVPVGRKAPEKKRLALLRPGRKTPAWRTDVERVREVIMTRDRILITTEEGLVVLQTQNGRRIDQAPLALKAGARFLGAHGQLGALGFSDGSIVILNIISTTMRDRNVATLSGPGDALAFYTYEGGRGIALLFTTGDLIFYDRDWKMIDRAKVRGQPIRIARGNPMAPGPIVLTTAGLFAFGEVIDTPIPRDVDALLLLAETFYALQSHETALRIATEVARISAGRVAEAERLRAKIFRSRKPVTPAAEKAATWAERRACLAADPTKPLPPFSLAGR